MRDGEKRDGEHESDIKGGAVGGWTRGGTREECLKEDRRVVSS